MAAAELTVDHEFTGFVQSSSSRPLQENVHARVAETDEMIGDLLQLQSSQGEQLRESDHLGVVEREQDQHLVRRADQSFHTLGRECDFDL